MNQAEFTVLHLSGMITWGGGEQQLIYLYQALGRWWAVRQLIVCPVDSCLAAYCNTHQIRYIAYKKTFGLGLAWYLRGLVKYQFVDIIHTHDAYAHTHAWLSKLLFKNQAKLVVSRKGNARKKQSLLSYYKYNSKYISKLICVSEAVRSTMATRMNDHSKLSVIYDSVDISRFQSSQEAQQTVRAEFHIPPTSYVVGTVAALIPQKRVEIFIAVAKQVSALAIPTTFLIIGDGPLRTSLQTLAQQAGLAERVIFTGFRTDIPVLLANFDVFVLTSCQEALGSSILEAMACHVPVVATRADGIPEVVINRETGLLAAIDNVDELVNAVISLLQDRDLRAYLTDNATRQLEKFSVQTMAEKTWAIYQSVIP